MTDGESKCCNSQDLDYVWNLMFYMSVIFHQTLINYKIKGGKGLLGREICTLSPKERKTAGKGRPLSTE